MDPRRRAPDGALGEGTGQVVRPPFWGPDAGLAVGALVKRANGYRCQVCEALGLPALGFRKRNGALYVEAHHVLPVASLAPGALGPENVITVCANHHRQLHYGDVGIAPEGETFRLVLEGQHLSLSRHA